jgi:hypothetical protein
VARPHAPVLEFEPRNKPGFDAKTEAKSEPKSEPKFEPPKTEAESKSEPKPAPKTEHELEQSREPQPSESQLKSEPAEDRQMASDIYAKATTSRFCRFEPAAMLPKNGTIIVSSAQ